MPSPMNQYIMLIVAIIVVVMVTLLAGILLLGVLLLGFDAVMNKKIMPSIKTILSIF